MAAAHLKGSQAQFDVEPGRDSCVLGQEGKDRVVHAKQRDEEQRGLGQSPAGETVTEE